MPIDTTSEQWENGALLDRIGTEIGDKFLLNNPEKAYNVSEIVDWILENQPETIPRSLREKEDNDGVTALVAAALDRLDRRNFVDCKYVSNNDGSGELYYTNSDHDTFYPNMDIKHDILPRIEDLENDAEDIKESLDERLSKLEYEIYRSS